MPAATPRQTEPAEGVLSPDQARQLASLVSIGGQSGDTVLGLSAVRRTRHLAFVFAGTEVADNTWQELVGRRGGGAQVLRVADMAALTRGLGRADVSVVAVKAGSLADGIAARLVAADFHPDTR